MDDIINYIMETPGNTNPNVLRGILNNSNSGLPSVSNVDDGKVLTVVDGAWAPAAASGGGVLVVHVEDGVLDKTFQEIVAADLAVLKADVDDYGSTTLFYSWEISESYYTVRATSGVHYTADSANGYPVYDDGGGSI